jgi:hypothetical protein
MVVEARALTRAIEAVEFPGTEPALTEAIAFAGRVVELHGPDAGETGPEMAREHAELATAVAQLITAVEAWEASVDGGFVDGDAWRDGRSRALAAARAVADDLAVHTDHEQRPHPTRAPDLLIPERL